MQALINQDALTNYVNDLVDKRIASWKGNNQIQPQAFRRKGAAKYISVSISTFDRMVKRGEIPSTVHGNIKYFRKVDLDDWIYSGITAREAQEVGLMEVTFKGSPKELSDFLNKTVIKDKTASNEELTELIRKELTSAFAFVGNEFETDPSIY